MTRKTIAFIACCLISPAVAAAQTGGLTRVQLLALQQELKEQCGLQHATGVMDGPTRHAIAVCNKKYGTQGNGAALLAAMNVGFGTGENEPSHGMGGIMGNDRDEGTVTSDDSRPKKTRAVKTKGGTRTRTRGTGSNRGDMDTDAWKHGVDSTSGGVDVDARTDDRRMARDSAEAGRRDGRVRNPGQGKKTKAGRDSIKY